MELDDMKLAWQTLDRRLETQAALNLHLFKEGKLDKLRAGLRPMQRLLMVQLLFGVAMIVLAAPVWTRSLHLPHLLLAGLAMHVYGVGVIVTSARALWLAGQIDYAAPVLAIQQQLAQLRSFYLRSGWWTGMPWWVLWIAATMLLGAWMGIDLYVHAPQFFLINIAIGVLGWILTYLAYRWYAGKHPDSLRKLEAQSTRGIQKAEAFLDEIARFERT